MNQNNQNSVDPVRKLMADGIKIGSVIIVLGLVSLYNLVKENPFTTLCVVSFFVSILVTFVIPIFGKNKYKIPDDYI